MILFANSSPRFINFVINSWGFQVNGPVNFALRNVSLRFFHLIGTEQIFTPRRVGPTDGWWEVEEEEEQWEAETDICF